MYVADTIAAIATAAGRAAIGILRVSGPDAAPIVERVFRPIRLGPWKSHRLRRGSFLAVDGKSLDEGVAIFMQAPHSYTGEDVIELHTHGNPLILRALLEAVCAAGARAADAGEFTRRAFLNGKLDLAQAEAVADLIDARTIETASIAASQLEGRLSAELAALRKGLMRAKALLEVQIDFADEDIELDQAQVLTVFDAALAQMATLVSSYRRGRLYREGVRVAIAGEPNVGKSSLLNALLGEERAIVTPVPGTTRDSIEEAVDFAGIPVILTDTAGLRTTDDPVEEIGVARARAIASGADVLLVVLDVAQPAQSSAALSEIANLRRVYVLNKSDLAPRWTPAQIEQLRREGPVVFTSAKTGAGLDALRRAVTECLAEAPSEGSPVLTRARQHDALRKAAECLGHARSGLVSRLPPDLIAVDVQAALDHLASLTGSVSSDDILDLIFAEFCIGK